MTASRRAAALLLSALALGAAGCGSSGDTAMDDAQGSGGDNELASSDTAEVLQAQRTIDAACGSGGGVPDGSPAAIAGAVSTLAGLTRQYPDRVYETGNVDRAETMVTVAEQASEQLRRCGITAEADRLATVADGA